MPSTNSTTKKHLKRAGSAALLTAFALSALAGCGRDFQPTANAGPRDLGPLTSSAVANGKPATVGVPFASKEQLRQLAASGMDIWYVDAKKRMAFGQLTSEQLPMLKQMGLNARIVQAPGIFNDFDKGYRTYDQIKADLQALAARHPELASFIDLGDSWEKTAGKGGRDIIGLRIGKGDGSGKPAVLFAGNHHAREIVTPEIVMNIATMLLEGYGKDAELTHFVENRDIYVIPMVNPDGHRLASEGNDWRKNTNLTVGGGTNLGYGPSGPGVDLNRNYGYKWGGPGAATQPSNPTFRGPGPFSEPETQAMKRLVESRKFTFLMSYHSFSNLILWPWGHTDAPPPDKRLPAIGQQLGKLSGYKPQQSVDLYPTSGDTTDWAFGEHGILAYTTEIGAWGDGFDPPFKKMGQFWKENEPGARLLLRLADNPSHVFGPEADVTASRNGLVATARGAAAGEVFFGRPGADGTGTAIRFDAKGQAVLPAAPGGAKLALVHAKDAKGNWGPLQAVFTR